MLNLKIVSPESIIFEGDVNMVKVPGVGGEFEILNKHAAILSVLQKGIVEYEPSVTKQRTQMQILGGFVEVKNNKVDLVIET